MRLVGKILVIVLAVIGGFVVLGFAMTIVGALSQRPEPLPDRMVLSVNLTGGVTEIAPSDPFARLAGHHLPVLSQLVQALDRASRDSRVAALVVRLDAAPFGMATAQELREAVANFRQSGKRAVVFSEDMGGFGGSSVAVYLASAFQEVWLQPSGEVGLVGFIAQSPFLKGTFDMLGIEPQFGARYEYKSAIETFTHDRFSKEARESLDALVGAWTNQAAEGIAKSRNIPVETVRALIDKGPLLAEDAKAARLVDKLGYWDELQSTLLVGGARMVGLDEYAQHLAAQPEAVNVALIVGAGEVHSGGNDDSARDETDFAAGRVTQAFRDAVKDPSVKAILFRIDSPGGSYTASDAVWREVSNARAAGKPVIVSMGDLAASGGYCAAMAADWIVADPGTITGSIGVFGGKFVIADLWKKLGVSWDEVHRGDNAGMWSANAEFTKSGWDKLNAMLDHVYDDFTTKAEKARKLDAKAMDAVARGRVWAGDRAKEVGLIDETGGYPEAFAAVRRLARLPSQMPLRLVAFPRQLSTLEQVRAIIRRGDLTAEAEAALTMEARMAAMLRPFAALMSDGDKTLLMPPIETR